MARQDNVKIITTALLVVLLLSLFIFGFVFRNEIYQKFQMASKSKDTLPEERIIEKETTKALGEETIPSPKDSNPNKKIDLADIPPLDEMEDNFTKPQTSISVTQPHTLKKNKNVTPSIETETEVSNDVVKETKQKVDSKPESKTRLQEKIDKIEENLANPKEEMPKTKIVQKQKEPKKYIAQKKTKTTKQKLSAYSPHKQTTKTAVMPSKNSSLEARVKSMESKFILQNQKNDQRFIEIEKRIERLEKSLGSN